MSFDPLVFGYQSAYVFFLLAFFASIHPFMKDL